MIADLTNDDVTISINGSWRGKLFSVEPYRCEEIPTRFDFSRLIVKCSALIGYQQISETVDQYHAISVCFPDCDMRMVCRLLEFETLQDAKWMFIFEFVGPVDICKREVII